jgi:uncharacterized SAM-binding protein YcdF (DUF218 family)
MLLRTLILPPAGPLLLAFAGAWLLSRRAGARGRRLGLALLLAGLGSLWLLALPVVAFPLARLAEREPVLDITNIPPAQAIVILGGGGERHSAPEYDHLPAAGSQLLERLAYGAYLARRTSLPVLVTGTATETQAMRLSLERDFGVQVRWVEPESRDTFENAEYSARLLRAAGVSRILLVTHATHEYRARREFEASGLNVVPAPTGASDEAPTGARRFVPNATALTHSSEALYELLGDWARRAMAALGVRRHAPQG